MYLTWVNSSDPGYDNCIPVNSIIPTSGVYIIIMEIVDVRGRFNFPRYFGAIPVSNTFDKYPFNDSPVDYNIWYNASLNFADL